ncbi:branched-chain amino acid ABC transporter permease [Amycolatopsis sp. NPDC005232]|uniref:branched-chain amino acid ABC transporter permease n=1 Tax=Amycolatopsis sp. NPDC005232 TaxID=3157027 RepID=UPI00339E2CC0
MSLWYDEHLVLIQATMVSVLFALSIQVPLRFGVFSFAGVGSYGIGAYATAILVTRYEYPVFGALAAGALAAALIGYGLAWLLQRLSGLYLAMATVAFDLLVSVLAVNGGEVTGGATGLFGVVADVTTLHIFLVTVVVLAVVAASEHGRLGRKIAVVREDPELSAALGIEVHRVRRAAFVASGTLGGLAGGLNTAITTTIAPGNIDFALIVLAVTMIVVGGASSWKGAVIGAFVFTWLPTVLAFVGDWKGVGYGIVVAAVAIWLPGGVVGVTGDALRKLTSRRRTARLPDRESPAPGPAGPSRDEAPQGNRKTHPQEQT